MPAKLVPAARISCESQVKNSRFIAHIGPAFNVAEARSFIEDVSSDFQDASHNVPAYIIGFGPTTTEHASDDGEPSGTAGRPALSVLRGSGLGDVVLVITRYFGGTKLGTGGLVKAYSNAARLAVDKVPRAVKLNTHRLELTVAYPLFDPMERLIAAHHGFNLEKDFSGQVRIEFSLPAPSLPGFQAAVRDLTNGDLEPTILLQDQTALQPIRKHPA